MDTAQVTKPGTILSFEPYGDGWEWSYTGDHLDEDEPAVIRQRTNRQGDGLWVLERSNSWYPAYEWKQHVGTRDFRLSGDRRTARAAVKRRLEREFTYHFGR